MKSWLQDNDLKMYSIYNEEKSVFAERFIRILKNKIYKYLTLMLRNVHIYKLDSIVDKFNNRQDRTIKINSVDAETNTYIDFDIENNDKGPKFKVADHVTISKFKNILQKATLQIGQKRFLLLKKLNITVDMCYQ